MNNRDLTKKLSKKIHWVCKDERNKFNPVNKSINDLIKRNKQNNKNTIENLLINRSSIMEEDNLESEKFEGYSSSQKIGKDEDGVSIITCTNKVNYISHIFHNYLKQNLKYKELIIILNNNRLNLAAWRDRAKDYDNVRVFQIDEKVSLGECLNFGVSQSNYSIIAKFDDDDYYGSKYLTQAVSVLKEKDVHLVGKSTSYVYFENKKILAIRNPGRENCYIYRVEGPTLVFKKEIFGLIKFHDKNLGEDVQFCRDCCKNGLKIFSTNKENFVYVRHDKKSNHTWTINDDYYMKLCTIIGQIKDISSYVS